jgi:hypothetical protein
LIWQAPHTVGALHEVFGEGTVAVIAKVPQARAEMGEAPRTLRARAARHNGMNGDPHSLGELTNFRSRRDNHACRFVTEDARQRDAKRIAREVMEV